VQVDHRQMEVPCEANLQALLSRDLLILLGESTETACMKSLAMLLLRTMDLEGLANLSINKYKVLYVVSHLRPLRLLTNLLDFLILGFDETKNNV
jgi:hypothetical protein